MTQMLEAVESGPFLEYCEPLLSEAEQDRWDSLAARLGETVTPTAVDPAIFEYMESFYPELAPTPADSTIWQRITRPYGAPTEEADGRPIWIYRAPTLEDPFFPDDMDLLERILYALRRL